SISSRLEYVILKCLEKEPSERFTSALSLREEFEKCRNSKPDLLSGKKLKYFLFLLPLLFVPFFFIHWQEGKIADSLLNVEKPKTFDEQKGREATLEIIDPKQLQNMESSISKRALEHKADIIDLCTDYVSCARFRRSFKMPGNPPAKELLLERLQKTPARGLNLMRKLFWKVSILAWSENFAEARKIVLDALRLEPAQSDQCGMILSEYCYAAQAAADYQDLASFLEIFRDYAEKSENLSVQTTYLGRKTDYLFRLGRFADAKMCTVKLYRKFLEIQEVGVKFDNGQLGFLFECLNRIGEEQKLLKLIDALSLQHLVYDPHPRLGYTIIQLKYQAAKALVHEGNFSAARKILGPLIDLTLSKQAQNPCSDRLADLMNEAVYKASGLNSSAKTQAEKYLEKIARLCPARYTRSALAMIESLARLKIPRGQVWDAIEKQLDGIENLIPKDSIDLRLRHLYLKSGNEECNQADARQESLRIKEKIQRLLDSPDSLKFITAAEKQQRLQQLSAYCK
ncbi:MAG: hypothetical protein K2X27_02475, partial [Candidatus Obscuribacterales bacterium]|nr:hypothetical protein [Candidatus Obscuribacterales bacterium]